MRTLKLKIRIGIIAIVIFAFALWGVLETQRPPYKFKIDEHVCVMEKFNGVVIDRIWSGGNNFYSVTYVSDNIVQTTQIKENLLISGICEKKY